MATEHPSESLAGKLSNVLSEKLLPHPLSGKLPHADGGPPSETLSSGMLSHAVQDMDASKIVTVLVNEVKKIPFAKLREIRKKLKCHDDYQVTQHLIAMMSQKLGHDFLQVDLRSSSPRNVDLNNWDSVTACKRSEAGTTGIYFIQNSSESGAEIIVAKPISHEDFDRQLFVSKMAVEFFKIPCPNTRLPKTLENFKKLDP